MRPEQEEQQAIMSAILRQAIDDYIKLQHPTRRQKKYEQEAFWSANDLLWDSEYRLLEPIGDNGEGISLRELCMLASARENVSLKSLRHYLVTEAKHYWSSKEMRTISIPDDIVLEGHVYYVRNGQSTSIDYEEKVIVINKQSPNAEQELMEAVVEIACYHTEVRTSTVARKEISAALFRALKVNNCFVGS